MLLVDTYNLYHGAHSQHGRLVDYDNLRYYFESKYPPEVIATRYAYVAQTPQSRTFAAFLRGRGFIVRNKVIRQDKLDSFDVDLTVDAMGFDENAIIICSASLNLMPLIRHLSNEGCLITVHACGIPNAIRDLCACHDLPVGVLQKGLAIA